ncbi:glycine--tRNA ligase subunit beta [Bacillus sp. CGMCC 1.16607]|uniref:glycine--tRNA ligase subunit beta n=1 Tax=Bacillus sp. CGMCC 1.16607 TaxID=3351842 RepID=UPI0036411177
MSKRDLLLEIGLEEMPARFISETSLQLEQKVTAWLDENKISYDKLYRYSTPRRLAILLEGVAEKQEDSQEEAKGPAKKIALNDQGEWSKAAIGFTKGQGVNVEDIYFKEINGIEYAHVNKFTKGKETKELFPNLKQVITNLYFPKNMRWANQDLKYIRPIKWLVALFGTEIIPFEITNVHTDRFTFGHRFLGERITLDTPSDYVQRMLSQFVMVDASERKTAILSQLENLMEEKDWQIPVDEDLLEEVTNLVEYPTVLFGQFEESFLDLPEQVLITSMKEHQRYFPVKSIEGQLLPFFVTVRNGDHMHLETVAKGNEKVLRARLSDAAFFYKEDQKLKIDDCLQKLNSIVYHEEIGTLSNKMARVRELANKIALLTIENAEEQKAVDRAAEICKFDLVTNLVYEFPELQGVMGEKYAMQKGEDDLVALAINEHYMPRSADGMTPTSNVGAVLALADKLDTITSFFAIGKIPSGSQDPYALRRQASGIVQILLDRKWNVSLEEILSFTINLIEQAKIQKKSNEEMNEELISFFKLRIKHLLQEKGIRYDIIEAILGGNIGVVGSLVSRALILDQKKADVDFKENMEALSRVLNIAGKIDEIQEVKPSLFENEFEKTLYEQIQLLEKNLDHLNNDEKNYELLISLKPAIDNFFDHTMVMVDNQEIKMNRLSLLATLANYILNFAKVNEIIVK